MECIQEAQSALEATSQVRELHPLARVHLRAIETLSIEDVVDIVRRGQEGEDVVEVEDADASGPNMRDNLARSMYREFLRRHGWSRGGKWIMHGCVKEKLAHVSDHLYLTSSGTSAKPKRAVAAANVRSLGTQEDIPAQVHEVGAVAAPLCWLDVLWHYDCVVSPHPRAGAIAPPFASTATPPSPASPNDDALKSNFQRYILPRVFSTFDHNGDGRVSTHEIARIFHSLGIIPPTAGSIRFLLARHVPNSDGRVSEQEFCLLYESVCSNNPNTASSSSSANADMDQDLLAAFQVFDKDGNGFISPLELQSVLCSLGFPQARQLDACMDMIARVDENGDGQVDFSEFKKLFDSENASLLLISSF
ncbi:hypothetical protein L7F22_047387 [Adiantum nelumboides]|nr:hypothetical protein [Adiantum nelumboides]